MLNRIICPLPLRDLSIVKGNRTEIPVISNDSDIVNTPSGIVNNFCYGKNGFSWYKKEYTPCLIKTPKKKRKEIGDV